MERGREMIGLSYWLSTREGRAPAWPEGFWWTRGRDALVACDGGTDADGVRPRQARPSRVLDLYDNPIISRPLSIRSFPVPLQWVKQRASQPQNQSPCPRASARAVLTDRRPRAVPAPPRRVALGGGPEPPAGQHGARGGTEKIRNGRDALVASDGGGGRRRGAAATSAALPPFRSRRIMGGPCRASSPALVLPLWRSPPRCRGGSALRGLSARAAVPAAPLELLGEPMVGLANQENQKGKTR